LEIYPNGVDTFYKGNISTYLNRNNEKDDYSVHIAVNRVFFIRNYYDTYCYKAASNNYIFNNSNSNKIFINTKKNYYFIFIFIFIYFNSILALPIEYLGKSVYTSGHPNLISKSQLYSNIGNNKCILENNKCVFGVYFQVYKTEKGLVLINNN